jgi:hypothetical protein
LEEENEFEWEFEVEVDNLSLFLSRFEELGLI